LSRDALFVAYKPSNISSNQFLGRLKRKYNIKKAGYSGTLDPFAKGVLIVAFGKYTSLFRFLNKTPKSYRATLWLGAKSDSLDIEMVESIEKIDELRLEKMEHAIQSLVGNLTYHPPIFSAKRIDGRRAYDLAREGKEVVLNTIESTIYSAKLTNYSHPFVTFEVTVSEGTYVRSLGKMIAENLGVKHGSLSALERLCEGNFKYQSERKLDIRESLNIPQNSYSGDKQGVLLGHKLDLAHFTNKDNGYCWVDFDEFISIFEIAEDSVKYILNRIYL